MFDQYMALHNDWPISDCDLAISRQKHNMRRVLIGCRGYKKHSVNNYNCVIDTHIILVRIVRVILVLNTPLKANILLKCSLTLTILIIIWISIFDYFNLIEISFIRLLFMCLMSVMEVSLAEYSADHSANPTSANPTQMLCAPAARNRGCYFWTPLQLGF
jgi:hypothetical protein